MAVEIFKIKNYNKKITTFLLLLLLNRLYEQTFIVLCSIRNCCRSLNLFYLFRNTGDLKPS